ncbi:EthD family reductase [Nostoc sp. NIES-2111]
MVVVSVMYPNTPGSRFDHRYYVEDHGALLQRCWAGMGLTEVRLLRGLGALGGGPATYQVTALLTFTSMAAFEAAVAAHGAEVLADIPRFTDVQPLVQVNSPLG